MSASQVPIALCADDFGIAPGVSEAIATLAARGRLSAISCMTDGVAWRAEAPRLRDLPPAIELGVHITLTGPSRSLGALAGAAFLGRLDIAAATRDIEWQLDSFETMLGRRPDFIDGHLHVHELPILRDLVAAIWQRRLGEAVWIRNTASPMGRVLARPVARLRASVLAVLGHQARRRWQRVGARTNADFAGVRDFDERLPYRALMQLFLRNARPGLLVMCHPGEPDAVLAAEDPVVAPRAEEFAYLASAMFEEDLAAAGAWLAPLSADASR